ncbi:MAG: bifunctional folylpolyglutamate synthase/dihydrofolate synthase [Lachnospiraceae bacterium]|nr:bifunctional folylpolyglutamate synthase/dihydrofolate synthase [Lachnospiraceae bacterium]
MSSCITDSLDTYEAVEKYILDIPRFTSKNSMESTRCFLTCLGNPDLKVKTIHVAGTNGKGSVCAYLRSILNEAGFSTGMFVSPHLVSMRERFIINGSMVSKEDFVWAFKCVAAKLDDMPEELQKADYHPTFFEYLFFMAIELFTHYNVEYMILETGLGGRLDATNAIDSKEVCVITSIGYDHTEYLGETLSEIAAEKAGIFRKDVPAVFFDKKKEVTRILAECAVKAKAEAAPISFYAIKDINSTHKTIDFSFQSNYYGYIRFSVPTIALYQVENAALAVAAIEKLTDRQYITREHLMNGINKMRWEGRMEEIMPSVFLDGAHNTDGIEAFLQTVKQDGCIGKRFLLFSMVKDKQYKDVMDMLASSGLFDMIGVVALQDKRALPAQVMTDYFRQYTDLQIQIYEKSDDALDGFTALRGEADRVYIVGSLYLAGEIKALIRRTSHD